jgi:hypothetical protein
MDVRTLWRALRSSGPRREARDGQSLSNHTSSGPRERRVEACEWGSLVWTSSPCGPVREKREVRRGWVRAGTRVPSRSVSLPEWYCRTILVVREWWK